MQAAPFTLTLASGGSKVNPTMSRKMGQAYLEQSIAELENQLRQVRMKKPTASSNVERKACLLDLSMLLYALPVVREWCRSGVEYAELLLPIDGQSCSRQIPCQEDVQLNIYIVHMHQLYYFCDSLAALAMLDILKKAEQPLSSRAREAIRWLERNLGSTGLAESRPRNQSHTARRSELRILDDRDMLTWSQILEKSYVPPARLDDENTDGEEKARIWQAPLQSVSLATQALLKALLRYSQDGKRLPVVALAESPSIASCQPEIINRVLVDSTSLQSILQNHFPTIPLDTLLPVSACEIAQSEDEEAIFRSSRHARSEQRQTLKPNRPDFSSQQSQGRAGTPSSSRSAARSPICQSCKAPQSPTFASPTSNSLTTIQFRKATPPLPEPTRHAQPKLLQRAAVDVQKSIHLASHSDSTRSIGGDLQSHRQWPSSRSHQVAQSKSALAPRIMLANPKSTARSLSTAT